MNEPAEEADDDAIALFEDEGGALESGPHFRGNSPKLIDDSDIETETTEAVHLFD